MQISKIIIENFKGIQRVELGPIKPINVLIGRNNAGKSSVFSAMQLISGLWDRNARPESPHKIPREHFRFGNDDVFENIHVSVVVHNSDSELEERIDAAIRSWNKSTESTSPIDEKSVESVLSTGFLKEVCFSFEATPDSPYFFLTSVNSNVGTNTFQIASLENRAQNTQPANWKYRLSRTYEVFRAGFSAPKEDETILMGIQTNTEFRTGGGPKGQTHETAFCSALFLPPYTYLKEVFTGALVIPQTRRADATAAPSRTLQLERNGKNLVSYLHTLNLNSYSQFKSVESIVRSIVPEIGRLHVRHSGNSGNLEIAFEWNDGHIVVLRNMGSGLEQLLLMACFLAGSKENYMLWEEPETHLHPGAQDVFLNEVEKKIGKRVLFVTTHSPVFIRSSDKIAVHVLTNPSGRSADGRTLCADDFNEALSAIGTRPGHLAQADIVIYVEGLRGAEVVEEWLEKWPEKDGVLKQLRILVQPFSPDEAGSNDFDLNKLKKVTPYMIMFVDRDNDHGKTAPKKERLALRDKCKEIGIPFILTEKRQIEDYFTPDAVKAGLPSNLVKTWTHDQKKPMGEQLEKGWKRHNRRIASLMNWADVSAYTGLMQIFTEIEQYAKQLLPAE